MKKITTLFKKDPKDLSRVINEAAPENRWVFDGEGIPTRKYDGTSCAIINGELYKRYDAKNGKKAPEGAIPCQEPDEITGHHPHWLKCDRSKKEDQYFFEGLDNMDTTYFHMEDGTYELCGPKINGNKEGFIKHLLIHHGCDQVLMNDFSYESIRNILIKADIEGIVFHHKTDGRMCKIRKSDFGIKR